MGMSDEDLTSVFRVISACMLFGNMEFKEERNSEQATLPDNTVAQKVRYTVRPSVYPTLRNKIHKSLELPVVAFHILDGIVIYFD